MADPARPALVRYGGAVLAVALMFGARSGLDGVVGHRLPYIVFLFAVIYAAWREGLGPSILAAALATFTAKFFFVPTVRSLRFEVITDMIGVSMFVSVSASIIAFSEANRVARRRMEAEMAERRRADEALRQSERRLRQLADTMPQIVWTADPGGSVDYFNGRWYEYTGMSPEATLTGDGWRAVVHPDDIGALAQARRRGVAEGQMFEAEARLRGLDDSYRWHLIRSAPVHDEAGRVARRFGAATDVDDLKRAGAALREADRRKDEFLATLAHELRNPLAPIRTALRLLAEPDGDGLDVEAERAMAERQVAHLARLIDDLMDVSRISRGKVELRRRVVDLAEVVGLAVEPLRASARRRGQDLTVTLPDGPVALDADPTRLEQVFSNLLGNAIKYTEPGGRIALTARLDGGEVVISIRDNGPGIDPEALPRLFEMFVQVGDPSTRPHGGLGIGLSLVRAMVELHGGRVEARSDGLGLGSEFIVRLPVVEPARVASGSSPERRRPADATPPRRRILVVDDNEDAANSLGRLLRRAFGQEVRVAHEGPSALESAAEFRPELVLLDIGMPGMDGYEVARRLRDRPEHAETTIIALTGWGQDADRRRSREAGFDHHLVKPVDPDDLARHLAGP